MINLHKKRVSIPETPEFCISLRKTEKSSHPEVLPTDDCPSDNNKIMICLLFCFSPIDSSFHLLGSMISCRGIINKPFLEINSQFSD